MANLRLRQPANSGREPTPAQPPRQGDSKDGELSDVDDDITLQPENTSDPVSYSNIIKIYWKVALEISVLVVVIYLFYVHCSTPVSTERALLDVLKEKCGSRPSRSCIESLLSSKTDKDNPNAKCETPDFSHLQSAYKTLNQNVNLLQKKWTEMSEPLKTLKEHHRLLETMSSPGKENHIDLGQVVADVKAVKASVEVLTNTLNEANVSLTETRNTLAETITNLAMLENRITQLDKAQNNVIKIVIPEVKSSITEIRGKADAAKRASEDNGGRLYDHITRANSLNEEFKKHRDLTNRKVEEFAGKHANTERKLDGEELDGAMTKAELSQLKDKSTFHDVALYLTLLNIIAVVIVVMYVRQTLSSAAATPLAPAAFHNNTQRGLRREEVYELSWTGPMEDSVCVVTFHAETQLKHAEQTRSVFESVQQPCPTIHTRVIRCHADIKLLPGSRVFLVFVDFNERNVILEDPTKGLGDLRVTTVRSLWRFGADVAVIYCGDRGSANLTSGLFNQDLGSIHRQKELTQLKRDDRILSIYSDFNITQKQHCRNFINRLLHRTP